jgi:hypothetical protein
MPVLFHFLFSPGWDRQALWLVWECTVACATSQCALNTFLTNKSLMTSENTMNEPKCAGSSKN